jgi:replication factor A1
MVCSRQCLAFTSFAESLFYACIYIRCLIITTCNIVGRALDAEIKDDAKMEEEPSIKDDVNMEDEPVIKEDVKMKEERAVVVKPKDVGVVVAKTLNAPLVVMRPKQDVKSASQIVNDQCGKLSTSFRPFVVLMFLLNPC